MNPMTIIEIGDAEETLGYELPGLYKRLLVEVGYGEIDHTAEIYHPAAVRDLYEPFFEDPKQLFNPYFPFGCNNETQELWIIDASAEKAASISHETVSDGWQEEDWESYEHWVEVFLEPVMPPLESDV